MVDGAPVRNSRILGVFAEIVHGPLGTLRAVEIAGQGIAAEARCTLTVLADKMHSGSDPPDAALQSGMSGRPLCGCSHLVQPEMLGAWAIGHRRDTLSRSRYGSWNSSTAASRARGSKREHSRRKKKPSGF